MGRNSMREITKVRMERARLIAISACDMLATKSLRGYTARLFLAAVIDSELQKSSVVKTPDY